MTREYVEKRMREAHRDAHEEGMMAVSEAVDVALALVQEAMEEAHTQNCGCHSRPISGDPCYAAYYQNTNHHPHPFFDATCIEMRAAARKPEREGGGE